MCVRTEFGQFVFRRILQTEIEVDTILRSNPQVDMSSDIIWLPPRLTQLNSAADDLVNISTLADNHG